MDPVSKNIKMVQTDKTDYKVPEFLLNTFNYIPSPQDFCAVQKETDEIPLWWTRDIDLPLTKAENRRAAKAAASLKNELETQRQRLETANLRFKALLDAQEKEYQRRAEYLEEQTRAKLEELELLKQQNNLSYQNKLLELELELQKTNLEKEFYEKETKKFELYEEKSRIYIEERQQLEATLAALDERLEADKQATSVLKEEAAEEYKQLGKTPSVPVITPDGIVEQGFMEPIKTKMERYDARNILEVKFLTLTDKETGSPELKNITFDVKRKGITVVYSDSERVLFNILSAIMRTLPSNLHVNGGDIRIEGESNAAMLRPEYREKIKYTINSLVDMLDRYARSAKSVRTEFKSAGLSEEKLLFMLNALGIDTKTAAQKISKLDELTRRKLAVAACLSMELPLTIMYEPEEEMTAADKARLLDLLHTQNTDKATLIFTADKYLAGALKSVSFYTFN